MSTRITRIPDILPHTIYIYNGDLWLLQKREEDDQENIEDSDEENIGRGARIWITQWISKTYPTVSKFLIWNPKQHLNLSSMKKTGNKFVSLEIQISRTEWDEAFKNQSCTGQIRVKKLELKLFMLLKLILMLAWIMSDKSFST